MRAALQTAVDSRAAAPAHASVQLSGGLDSQALATLVARVRPDRRTTLVTVGSVNPENPDERWARHTAARLSGTEHTVIDPRGYPRMFQNLIAAQFALEEPVPFAASAARLRHTADRLTGHRTGVHFNGQGGMRP